MCSFYEIFCVTSSSFNILRVESAFRVYMITFVTLNISFETEIRNLAIGGPFIRHYH